MAKELVGSRHIIELSFPYWDKELATKGRKAGLDEPGSGCIAGWGKAFSALKGVPQRLKPHSFDAI